MVMWGELVHFTPQTHTDIVEEGIAAGEHDVFKEVAPERLIAFHYGVIDVFLDALLVDVVSLGHLRIEEDLRAAEPLLAEDHFGSIG